MVTNPQIIPFLYPIFDKINPAGNENTKKATKKANCTKTVFAYDISKTSFNLGIKESTNTVINPHKKNKDVKNIKADLYDLFVDVFINSLFFINTVYFEARKLK